MMLSNGSVRAQKMEAAQKTAAGQEAEMQAMHRLVCMGICNDVDAVRQWLSSERS